VIVENGCWISAWQREGIGDFGGNTGEEGARKRKKFKLGYGNNVRIEVVKRFRFWDAKFE
jgi:hypothetical protein